MSLREISDTIKAYSDNEIQRIKERARFDYSLAKLISFTFHKPSEMPEIEQIYPIMAMGRDNSQDWKLIKAQMSAVAEYSNGKRGEEN